MQYTLTDNTLTLSIPIKGKIVPRQADLSELCKLDKPQVHRLLDVSINKVIGNEYHSTLDSLWGSLKAFGHFLQSKQINQLPTSLDEWQLLISNFYLWFLSQQDTSKAQLETRCKTWNGSIRPWLNHLTQSGLIPYGVIIPDSRLPKTLGDYGSPQNPTIIGEKPANPTPVTDPAEKVPINNTLAGPIAWLSDVAYLEQIEATMRHRDQVLGEALDDYWHKLEKDYASGQAMLTSISDDEWQARVDSGEWSEKTATSGRNLVTLASDKHPQGSTWALRIMQHQLTKSDDQLCLSAKALRGHPAFSNRLFRGVNTTPLQGLLSATALTPEQQAIIPNVQLFWRFLGLLTKNDMAVAMALLIREHANFNPESLAKAQLLDVRGKFHLHLADNGRQVFSVDKPRAGVRKRAALTEKAKRIVAHIVKVTQPVRDLLRRNGHPHWRYLFVGLVYIRQNTPGLGNLAMMHTERLTGASSGFTLVRAYPKLAESGIAKGTLDFAKIRNTQGVLAWFNEGSVHACARRLGNSNRVTIEHYIPKPLLAAWNERIIRRFQNTLLVLATCDEDYLLDVVDMATTAELHHFLAQLLYELPVGRSPIADELHKKMGHRFLVDHGGALEGDDQPRKPNSCLLNVRLKPASLAMLLAYRQWAKTNLRERERSLPDSNGIAPQHFIDLGTMLQSAAENDDINNELRDVLEIGVLQRTYRKALTQVPELLARLSRQSLKHTPR